MDRLLVTVPEAARLLSVGERTVWQLLEDGQLTRVKLGRSTRVQVGELHALVRGQAVTAQVEEPEISPGQSRAFHAKAGAVDRARRWPQGQAKKRALEQVAIRFRLDETPHTDQLSMRQASWAIDLLGEWERLPVEIETAEC